MGTPIRDHFAQFAESNSARVERPEPRDPLLAIGIARHPHRRAIAASSQEQMNLGGSDQYYSAPQVGVADRNGKARKLHPKRNELRTRLVERMEIVRDRDVRASYPRSRAADDKKLVQSMFCFPLTRNHNVLDRMEAK